MSELQTGKLELLFAHLSLNNVQNVKPLLTGALEEYQNFRTNLTYDQRKNVNLVRTFLQHVEREDWSEARDQMHGAQRAYQEYLGTTQEHQLSHQKSGYLQIHGKKDKETKFEFSEREDLPPLDKDKYMFRNETEFLRPNNNNANGTSTLPYENSRTGTPLRCGSARSQRVNLWSATSRTRTGNQWSQPHESKPQTPVTPGVVPFFKEPVAPTSATSLTTLTTSANLANIDEQGPTDGLLDVKQLELTDKGQGQNDVANQGQSVKVETSRVSVNGDQKSSRSSRPRSRSPESIHGSIDNPRPCKIADSYLALYREEWKQALDHLTRSAVKEETAVECLLYVLMEAYRLCLEEAKLQVLEFENAALNIISNGRYTYTDKSKLGVSGDIKHMKDYRREVSDLAVTRLQQQFLSRTLPIIHRRYGVTDSPALDAYGRRCIAVCWTLAVQDPVFHLDSSPQLLSKLDSSLYKTYRQFGTRIRYLVWPVLRLYQGGSVLCRGIAQGDGSGEQETL